MGPYNRHVCAQMRKCFFFFQADTHVPNPLHILFALFVFYQNRTQSVQVLCDFYFTYFQLKLHMNKYDCLQCLSFDKERTNEMIRIRNSEL